MVSYDFFKVILLVGVVQGFITTILLFTLQPKIYANRILAFLILFISLACLNFYLLETITHFTPFLKVLSAVIPLILIMPLGPLCYFYVKVMLYPEFRLTRVNRAHFYSTIIDLIPYVGATTLLLTSYLGFITSKSNLLWGNYIDVYFMYSDIPRWISLSVYLWFTYKLMSNFRATKKELVTMRWTKRFTLGMSIFAGLWLLHLIPYLIPSLSTKLLAHVGWYPIYTPLVILIYWVGINGLIISVKTNHKGHKKLDGNKVDQVEIALKSAMDKDKLYLNPELKLSDVVKHIDVPQKTVSAVLNQHLNKSFNEFVNDYRIEEIKSRLLNEHSQSLTITGIAYECGFNSQATFQRVFKKVTGITPKEFQQKFAVPDRN